LRNSYNESPSKPIKSINLNQHFENERMIANNNNSNNGNSLSAPLSPKKNEKNSPRDIAMDFGKLDIIDKEHQKRISSSPSQFDENLDMMNEKEETIISNVITTFEDRQQVIERKEDDGGFQIEIARCKNLLKIAKSSPLEADSLFEQHKLSYESFLNIFIMDANGLFDSDIVFRVNGQFFPWIIAAPMILSALIYKVPLPDYTTESLQSEFSERHGSEDSHTDITSDYESENQSSGWLLNFFFNKNRHSTNLPPSSSPKNVTTPIKNSPPVLSPNKNSQSVTPTSSHSSFQVSPVTSYNSPTRPSSLHDSGNNIPQSNLLSSNEGNSPAPHPEGHSNLFFDGTTEFSSPIKRQLFNNESVTADANTVPTTDLTYPVGETSSSVFPTSSEIESMNLSKGPNQIAFSVIGTDVVVTSSIYLWDKNDQVVISDIDGTITKSDLFGHILPNVFGEDWTQTGVAQFYTNIRNNGYQLLYLTARAIGQSEITKSYLQNVNQLDVSNKEMRLPDGPVFMSPNRVFESIKREVILRCPEQFKVACLKEIAALFVGPIFYAGFGNRESDRFSYKEVGIAPSKIFIIDEHGEIDIGRVNKESYTTLNEFVDEIFPPFNNENNHIEMDESFNDFNYWKTSSVNIGGNLDEIEKEIFNSTKTAKGKK
jgi:phosphatidate phosphatase LPIN